MNRILLGIGAAAGVAALIIACIVLYLVLARDKAPTPTPSADQDQNQPVNDATHDATLNLNKPRLPHMALQAQYAGPLADTVVQRWRDPVDGTVCYLYLPIVVHHSKSKVPGYVEYGGNYVGSIACMPPQPAAPKPAAAKPAPESEKKQKS